MKRTFCTRRQFGSICTAFAMAHAHAEAEAPVQPPVTAIAYCPHGDEIVAASQAGIWVLDVTKLELRRTIATSLEQVHDVAFSHRGDSLAVAGGVPGEEGSIEFIDWPSGKRRQTVQCHADVINEIAYTPDDERWITASSDGSCGVFVRGQEKPSRRLTKHSRSVTSIVAMPDGKTAVSGSRDETLRVWDLGSGEIIRTLHNHVRDVNCLSLRPPLSPAGSANLPMVASGSADRTIRFWQPTIGRMVRFVRLPAKPLATTWIGQGKRLAAACRDGIVREIDPDTAAVIRETTVGPYWLYSIAADPTDPDRVVVGGSEGFVRQT